MLLSFLESATHKGEMVAIEMHAISSEQLCPEEAAERPLPIDVERKVTSAEDAARSEHALCVQHGVLPIGDHCEGVRESDNVSGASLRQARERRVRGVTNYNVDKAIAVPRFGAYASLRNGGKAWGEVDDNDFAEGARKAFRREILEIAPSSAAKVNPDGALGVTRQGHVEHHGASAVEHAVPVGVVQFRLHNDFDKGTDILVRRQTVGKGKAREKKNDGREWRQTWSA